MPETAARKVAAAAVVLIRGEGDDAEIFLVQRSPKLRFMGGYFAFPGGTVDDVDRAAGRSDDAVFRACARREIREEVEVDVDEAALVPLARIVTPPFAPVRYDTRFYLARLPSSVLPRIGATGAAELIASRFVRPADALAEWRRGELPLAPPVLLLLECAAGKSTAEFVAAASALERRLQSDELPDMRFSPGVRMMSLKTATLPPATTTNAFLVGEARRWLIEPSPEDKNEQDRLAAALAAERAAGRNLEGILLTHHHPDHVGAVARFCDEFGLDVRAHPLTMARLPRDVRVRRGAPLLDGDAIELGDAPDGSPSWKLTALHTPGHAQGHLCFLDSRYRSLIAGDMLATVSTIVIDPPEGHMATYLASLARLRDLHVGTIYPAHGPPALAGQRLLEQFIRHRGERETKLRAALAKTPRATPEQLVTLVYADVDPLMHPIALRSLVAGIEKLVEERRVAD